MLVEDLIKDLEKLDPKAPLAFLVYDCSVENIYVGRLSLNEYDSGVDFELIVKDEECL